MRKYTRKQINQQVDRFRKTEFITMDDMQASLTHFIEVAIESGADPEILMEKIKNENQIN